MSQSVRLATSAASDAFNVMLDGLQLSQQQLRDANTQLDAKIAELERMRSRLDGCIGCGCLSLKKCQLYNKDDRLAEEGPGPRQILA